MRVREYFGWHGAKRLVAWMIRPRLAALRIRESWHAAQSRPIRSDIDLSNLPEVTLRKAITKPELDSVLDLYRRNPSRLIVAPRNQQALDEMLSRDVDFFRILDDKQNHVGNLGYQRARKMFSYLQIDYSHRSRGYALAAELAGEQMVAMEGVSRVYAQVFRNNHRALSTFFSLGWRIDQKESTQAYFTLKKDLS